ncbi:acyltransferase family protein [Diplodia corticola]|uniref:Acyltransferase family protein n=1 Tax=Diplodia corticola TaxID=236234 RepID=A0A1J9QTC5_9PEZI|nr:acyltransferase family protein [Diplodia corticola]OJD31680.1 acyltransferase family protein [Diplodia corticola]
MGNEKNVKWVEGLRGIASVSVIVTHLTRAFYFRAFLASDGEGVAPILWQMPIFRVIPQGRIGVTIFGFLTGFVCALKPLRQARAGQHSDALTSIAKSAFRRIPRLILPSTIAMIIAWLLAQMGAFHVAHRADEVWLREASPQAADSLYEAFADLWNAFRSVWTSGYMPYDDHQWAMLPLLKESMLAYVGLAATIFMKYKYRTITYFVMFCYFFQDSHPLVETFAQQLYFAMLLCDLSLHPTGQAFMANNRFALNMISPFLVIFGLYLGSYPADGPEWLTWSRQLMEMGQWLFPEGADIARRFSALGLDIVIIGLFFSSGAKEILSNRYFMWLGRNSFAVYLIHGTLLRTVLIWMLYGITGEPFEEVRDEEGVVIGNWIERPGPLGFAIAIPIWLVIVYTCAHFWTSYVDNYCAQLTQRLEKWVFEDEEKSIPLV